MKAVIFLATIAATLASANPVLHKRVGCYTGGEAWGGNREKAEYFTGQACDTGRLKGDYAPGQEKVQNFDTSVGQCVVFAIKKLENGIGIMQKERCEEALKQGIADCPNWGGIGTDGDWEFRVDINAGLCPPA
ncbi:hypothetical protein NM208_g9461 [Fusarium decemcellulare]|uniref:Uncharacterized protein n=1 Tax=Fusarium decemcellulare TaxID=57161 RepID=A0ACC1S1M1_9HYPO|nr:hypothetical protein NM208_g9461 [Fusarium decemcellulare]